MCGNKDSFVCKTTVLSALKGFLHLLGTHLDPAFVCPVCSHLPDHQRTVVLDGLVMGMQRVQRKVHTPPPTSGSFPNINLNEYLLVPFDRCRRLLHKYVTAGLSEPEIAELTSSLAVKAEWMMPFFQYVRQNEEASTPGLCPKPLREFLSEVSRTSPPGGSIITPDAVRKGPNGSLLDGWCSADSLSPQCLAEMTMHCRALARLALAGDWKELRPPLEQLLRVMSERAQQPLCNTLELSQLSSADADRVREWLWAPGSDTLNAVKEYGADTNRSNDLDGCTKYVTTCAGMSEGGCLGGSWRQA